MSEKIVWKIIIDTTTETTDSGGSRHSDGGRGALRRFGPQFCRQRRGDVGPRAPPLDPPSLNLSVDGMQLTWNEHIDTLRRKLLQRIAILARARKYIPTKYRLLLYNASIKPLFTYCCTVWSNCSQTNLDELFKLQKRCARLILDSPRDARSYDNFQKLISG